MLKRKNRISRPILKGFLQKSKVFTFDEIKIRFSNLNKDQNSKFSIIVSSKVSKKAVQRNLIKRLFYEKIRKNDFLKNSGKIFLIYIPKDFDVLKRKEIALKVDNFIYKLCQFLQKS